MIYLILLIALSVRLILINQSLWLDEAADALGASLPLSELLNFSARVYHPPLFHLILHFWLKLGLRSEWFLRLPNVLYGVANIYLLHLILQSLYPKKKSLSFIAALLLALNPLHIYYSQELRMYILNALLSTLSWYFLIKVTKSPDKPQKNWPANLGFLLATIANLYTFYGALLNLLAQIIFVIFNKRSYLKIMLFHSLLVFAAFIPWLPIFIRQIQGGRWLTETLPGWSLVSGALSLKSLLLIPAKFSTGRVNFSSNSLYLFAAAAITLYLVSLIFIGLKKKLIPFLFWFLTPLIAAFIISLKTPFLGYWRFIFILPAFVTLIAAGVDSLPRPLKLLNVALIAITFLLANTLFWITPAFQREDWRAATNFLKAKESPGSLSVFAFSDAFAPVLWYSPQISYSAPLTDLRSDPEKLELLLSQATLNKKTIYYFEYLSALTDPYKNLPAWFTNAGYVLKKTHNFSGVGFVYEYQAD